LSTFYLKDVALHLAYLLLVNGHDKWTSFIKHFTRSCCRLWPLLDAL